MQFNKEQHLKNNKSTYILLNRYKKMLSFVAALLLKWFAFYVSTPGLYEGSVDI